MPDSSLLNQGLTLMLAGMGTVFVFLSILVAAMTLMSAAVARLPGKAAPESGPSEEEIAAIGAAIAMRRKRR